MTAKEYTSLSPCNKGYAFEIYGDIPNCGIPSGNPYDELTQGNFYAEFERGRFQARLEILMFPDDQ